MLLFLVYTIILKQKYNRIETNFTNKQMNTKSSPLSVLHLKVRNLKNDKRIDKINHYVINTKVFIAFSTEQTSLCHRLYEYLKRSLLYMLITLKIVYFNRIQFILENKFRAWWNQIHEIHETSFVFVPKNTHIVDIH